MAEPGDEGPAREAQPGTGLRAQLYTELRSLARVLTRQLPPGQTLQPTALAHEAYLRLVRTQGRDWDGRRHFFGAAARAMREILIEQARRKSSQKRGGQARRVELAEGLARIEPPADDLFALIDAVERLQAEGRRLTEIVQLRYFTDLSVEETAGVVGASARTVNRDWRPVRAWLAQQLGKGPATGGTEGSE
jgi:RNA polymerase sigma factor (TIGR02999 family)